MLTIDCRSCSGGQDLNDELCFRSVLRVLSSGPRVDCMILSGDWEVRYDRDCVHALCSFASVVKTCQDFSESPGIFQDCRGCALSPQRFFGQLVDRLPLLPDTGQLSSIQVRSTKHKATCEDCIDRSRTKLLQMGQAIEELDRYVTRSAYMVVGAVDEG